MIKDLQYGTKMIEAVFKSIVPTFCQDIIAAILNSKMEGTYHQINERVIKLYKESRFYNFDLFFKKIQSRKCKTEKINRRIL